MLIAILVAALFLGFILVLIIRAACFKPNAMPIISKQSLSITDKGAEHLAAMIKIPTISNYDKSKMDEAVFEEFRNLLTMLYPQAHKLCPPKRIGHTGMLFHWKGKSSKAPIVLMAHYDVVPVSKDAWQHPPFCGEIFDNELWGRGAIDTKITVLGIMEATEAYIKSGFVPQNDIYISFAGDEEVSGSSCPDIVEYFKQNNIVPSMVIDEGGAVVQGVFPGVKEPIAVVGIGEKGMMNVQLSVKSAGGHASTPILPSALTRLGKAADKIERKAFKSSLSKPVAELFTTVGRYAPFALKLVFANLWCFAPLLKALSPKLGGEVSAMMKTTCAFTMASASSQINVLAQEASFGLNMRLLNLDTPENAEKRLNDVVNDSNIKIEVTHSQKASPYAQTSGENWQSLAQAVSQTWPKAIVSPYLMIACSDSRHFSQICRDVYKFSAMELSTEQRALIHNNNERIPLEAIDKNIEFFTRLINKL